MKKRPYLIENRLADVIALIQVLALDKFAHRSESALIKELKTTPKSTKLWKNVALGHPEFFRVAEDKEESISLIARHTQPINNSSSSYEKLSPEHMVELIKTSIKLYDSQLESSRAWTFWIPLAGALVGAFGGVFASHLLTITVNNVIPTH